MKIMSLTRVLGLVLLWALNLHLQAAPMGTAFTYQGRLSDGGIPAAGSYDLRFTIYDSTNSPGAIIAGPLTNSAVAVSNGLFAVALDFGAGVFTGPDRWLETGVRTNGTGAFGVLVPRQKLTAAPYAITAGNITGVIPNTSLAGAYGSAVTFTNAGNSFTGNGAGLTGLNASQLTAGTVPAAALSNAWKTTGNAGTTPGANFIGTTDNQPLEIKVNNLRVLRLEPTPDDIGHTNIVNVVAGSPANFVSPGVFGATISGGGAARYSFGGQSNKVTGNFGTVSGGGGNVSGPYATVGGGDLNTASGADAIIAGGDNNVASGVESAIGGGSGNVCLGTFTTVGGGNGNVSSNFASTIGGGGGNISEGFFSTVGGGVGNVSVSYGATVAGGNGNTAGGTEATVPGGFHNVAAGDDSFAAGRRARANHDGAFVWADSTDVDFSSTTSNQFLIRASGGVGIAGNAPLEFGFGIAGKEVNAGRIAYSEFTAGALDIVGGGTTAANRSIKFWCEGGATFTGVINAPSDRNLKTDFQALDPLEVLAKVVALPIQQWAYRLDDTRRHIGPVAQDFHDAFGLNGDDDKHIATVDADGVALAAIQGLNRKVEDLKSELKRRDAENVELKQRLARLEKMISSGPERR